MQQRPLQTTPGGILVGEGWATHFDDFSLHVIHQFFASIILLICSMTRAPEPLFERIEIVPHPDIGLAHLREWFPVTPVCSTSRFLKIAINRTVADRGFFRVARDRSGGRPPPGTLPLMGDGSLSGSARIILALHLSDGKPAIDRLAASAGLSRRTLQRQLAAEDTSFSCLLEEVRLDIALHQLEKGSRSMEDIAANLGFARQSTLTRAVRRWTGHTPSSLGRSLMNAK
jgi:AraC-like DNA-binding protein